MIHANIFGLRKIEDLVKNKAVLVTSSAEYFTEYHKWKKDEK